MRGESEGDSGFWSGFGSGCGTELRTWALFAIGSGLASVAGVRWGWGVAVGGMLVIGAGLWISRKRQR